MSEFNKCSNLLDETTSERALKVYNELLASGKDPLQEMLNLQNSLQETLYSKFPHRILSPGMLQTKGELTDFIKDQHQAINDEIRELLESIVGVSRPQSELSACWKKWKSGYDSIRNEKLDDNLSKDDIIEKNMEMIDIFHFIMNMFLGLGFSSKDIFVYYYLKNEENFNRQNNGY